MNNDDLCYRLCKVTDAATTYAYWAGLPDSALHILSISIRKFLTAISRATRAADYIELLRFIPAAISNAAAHHQCHHYIY
jgi:hypothetical protein